MPLTDKILRARDFFAEVLATYKEPAFMCSFGKDSMVLLHLLRTFGWQVPILFHADPWWPRKYAFARSVIERYGLIVHDYPPLAVSLWQGREIMAFTSHYQTGADPRALLHLPKNILPPVEGQPYLCATQQLLKRPTGTFNFPWDAVLVGHKSSDADQIAGKIPLHCEVKQNHGVGPDQLFPLRDWTDAEVWDYIALHDVPMQTDRYDVANRCEWSDKSTNSDYAHVCIACCDRRSTAAHVPCPRLKGRLVSAVTSEVPYWQPPAFGYFGERPAPTVTLPVDA